MTGCDVNESNSFFLYGFDDNKVLMLKNIDFYHKNSILNVKEIGGQIFTFGTDGEVKCFDVMKGNDGITNGGEKMRIRLNKKIEGKFGKKEILK